MDEGEYRGGWRCSSPLNAMYMMVHLDQEADNKVVKCQAPDCPDYFRVEPKSRRTMYCPHPEDPEGRQSKCASRTTSRDSRERQRRKKADAT
ncbi:MAG TPA: hypothetical protein VKA51_12495 [Rubrobacteraceae bacterium]|nr:hypothetical protein [Rubrobacteraceae bacterium]